MKKVEKKKINIVCRTCNAPWTFGHECSLQEQINDLWAEVERIKDFLNL